MTFWTHVYENGEIWTHLYENNDILDPCVWKWWNFGPICSVYGVLRYDKDRLTGNDTALYRCQHYTFIWKSWHFGPMCMKMVKFGPMFMKMVKFGPTYMYENHKYLEPYENQKTLDPFMWHFLGLEIIINSRQNVYNSLLYPLQKIRSPGAISGDTIKIFAAMPHAHLLGTKIWTKHVRNGTELKEIFRVNTYDFNYQVSRLI